MFYIVFTTLFITSMSALDINIDSFIGLKTRFGTPVEKDPESTDKMIGLCSTDDKGKKIKTTRFFNFWNYLCITFGPGSPFSNVHNFVRDGVYYCVEKVFATGKRRCMGHKIECLVNALESNREAVREAAEAEIIENYKKKLDVKASGKKPQTVLGDDLEKYKDMLVLELDHMTRRQAMRDFLDACLDKYDAAFDAIDETHQEAGIEYKKLSGNADFLGTWDSQKLYYVLGAKIRTYAQNEEYKNLFIKHKNVVMIEMASFEDGTWGFKFDLKTLGFRKLLSFFYAVFCAICMALQKFREVREDPNVLGCIKEKCCFNTLLALVLQEMVNIVQEKNADTWWVDYILREIAILTGDQDIAEFFYENYAPADHQRKLRRTSGGGRTMSV